MDYKQAEEWILEIPKFTKKNGFSVSCDFYEYLGRPGEKSRIVHVAGTNGKGSTCAYLESFLLNAGHSVGLFTSPHLITMRERMRVDREDVSEEEFLSDFNLLSEFVNKYREDVLSDYYPTFFEWLFFQAMLYFDRHAPEYIILETGLGGALDTTNVVEQKELTLITGIAYDHMEYLGNTLPEIAGQKAGILRKNVPLIYWSEVPEVDEVIENTAKKVGCYAIPISDEYLRSQSLCEKHIDFSVSFSYPNRYDCRVMLPVRAAYQIQNLMMALEGYEILAGHWPSQEDIDRVVEETHWPCRMEEILPGVWADGAHNPDGIRAFVESVAPVENGRKDKSILLFAVVKDKDYEEMLSELLGGMDFEAVVLTTVGGYRAADLAGIGKIAGRYFRGDIRMIPDVTEAFLTALSLRGPEGSSRSLYVVGSLYLVGEVRRIVHSRAMDWKKE
mgnify:CR=1 FL=1